MTNKIPYIGIVAVMIVCACSSGGRVLHVENWASVPYTAVDERLKHRVQRSLIRNRLLTEADLKTCLLNIMEIDNYYFIEVWPHGVIGNRMFRTTLKKPLLIPTDTHFDFRGQDTALTAPPSNRRK